MTYEQNVFRRGLEFVQLAEQNICAGVRREHGGKFQPAFELQIGGDDFGGLPGAQKRAGKDQVEAQFHFQHRGGGLPELAATLGCERSVGIVLKIHFAAFNGGTVAQKEHVHAGKIHRAAPGAMSEKCNIFQFGFRAAVL